MTFPYPLISVEEHWLSQTVVDFYHDRGLKDPHDEESVVGIFLPRLKELGDVRLQSLDENGISVQVVSHAANSIALDGETCRKVNDELHSLITGFPGRFAAFATLPMANPDEASQELQRCHDELGFVGTMIDSNCAGRFYDDPHFWPVFATAEKLDIPVYLHPAPNPQTKPLLYEGNYPTPVADTLSQFGWGWHSETAVSFLRLFSAAVFDRYPRLKMVLGHHGEMLPFQLDRIERITSQMFPRVGVNLERTLRQVWDENVWVSISGMFFTAPMATVLRQCKPERILYSVDYPFGHNEAGPGFLKSLKAEGLVSDEDLEKISYKNAEGLLKIKTHRSREA